MNFPVFDLHCDTVSALIDPNSVNSSNLRSNQLHIDLERAKIFPGYAQCFACFTTYSERSNPVDIFEKQLAAIQRELTNNQDIIQLAYCAEDIENNRKAGVMSAVLTIEGPAGFGFDPALLEDLYKIGFRMSTLSWNEKNPLVGSHKTGGGLTDQGRAYLNELQRLGMLVDVSHISDEGFWDVIDITNGPVVASHSNSRIMHNVSRNISDEMFLEICRTGGVVGINLYSAFLGEYPTLDTVCDHIFHFLELDPDGRHICLGGDLDGCDILPDGFSGIHDYPKLSDRLLERGLCKQMLYDIFWNNAIGVMNNAVHNYSK